jgi:hypothetical protein
MPLFEADEAVNGPEPVNAKMWGDNHAQAFACDSSAVGVVSNVDDCECR